MRYPLLPQHLNELSENSLRKLHGPRCGIRESPDEGFRIAAEQRIRIVQHEGSWEEALGIRGEYS